MTAFAIKMWENLWKIGLIILFISSKVNTRGNRDIQIDIHKFNESRSLGQARITNSTANTPKTVGARQYVKIFINN